MRLHLYVYVDYKELTSFAWSQYVLWANETDLDSFYSNSKIRSMYKQHLWEVVNRVNSINGASLDSISVSRHYTGVALAKHGVIEL